jgi:hypothetical protein
MSRAGIDHNPFVTLWLGRSDFSKLNRRAGNDVADFAELMAAG